MQGATRMEPSKGAKILAKSFFKELRENGYDCNQILAISTELIDLVTRDLRGDAPVVVAPVPVEDAAKILAWRSKS
jgi:hypothetical protein